MHGKSISISCAFRDVRKRPHEARSTRASELEAV